MSVISMKKKYPPKPYGVIWDKENLKNSRLNVRCSILVHALQRALVKDTGDRLLKNMLKAGARRYRLLNQAHGVFWTKRTWTLTGVLGGQSRSKERLSKPPQYMCYCTLTKLLIFLKKKRYNTAYRPLLKCLFLRNISISTSIAFILPVPSLAISPAAEKPPSDDTEAAGMHK